MGILLATLGCIMFLLATFISCIINLGFVYGSIAIGGILMLIGFMLIPEDIL